MSPHARGSRARIAAVVIGALAAATLIGVGIAESSTSGGSQPAAGPRSSSSPSGSGSSAPPSGQPQPPLRADHPAATPGAKPCTAVTVLASLENADMVKHLAAAYEMSPRDVHGHCVDVKVDSAMSGLAEQQVRDGFRGASTMSRPDVWLPDSSAWLELARPHASLPSSAPSIAQSAVVLAMPIELASALHWVSNPPTWAQIFAAAENPNVWKRTGHPQWGSFKIGKATPELATSGLLSLTGAYRAAAGDPAQLTPADIASPSVQKHVAASELPTAHYMSAPAQFLFHAREADQTGSLSSYLSAMFMDETTVWDYNRGVIPTMQQMGMVGMGGMSMTGMGGSSGGMKHGSGGMKHGSGGMKHGSGGMKHGSGGMKHGSGGSKLDPPHEKLVPIYPSDGVYMADNPAAILTGSWVSASQRAAAADFVRYARSAQGQAVVRANGYRDIRGDVDAQVSKVALAESNVDALSTPDAATLGAVQRSFPTVRKRAKVLFLLDVSGSMRNHIKGGTSKLDAAKRAIADSLSYFDPDDRIGLAAFSNRPGGRITPGVVSPIRTLKAGKPAFLSALHRLHAIAETPLYSAVDNSVHRLADSYDPHAINAVVLLSDGHNNTDHSGSRMQMLHVLAQVHKHVPILVFTLGYGHRADTATLEAISSASGAHYFNASNPDTIKQILADDLVTSF